MQRIVVTGADLSGAALADLKDWLGITRSEENALLEELLQASIALCEAFTGQAPLEQTVEERFAPRAGRSALSSRPVRAFVSAEEIAQDGSRSALDSADYAFATEAAGAASFELKRSSDGQAVVVRIVAGIAADWEGLPSALKQGVIRMAAYHYRDRDADSDPKRTAPPPASVAALWRPWRALRLA